MGWVMLFWVVVIVAVPTVLWFLLSTPPVPSRRADESPDAVPSTLLFLGESDREKGEEAAVPAGGKGGGR